MYISGFTFVRNAIKYDYPVVESIQSVLPLCDEFVITVGKSEDGTLKLIQDIGSDKIHIIETEWDDNLREGGRILAVETDKAYAAINPKSDWAIYIQADEILHEKFHSVVLKSMLKWKDYKNVEGLLFNYLHFYGSYSYVGDSRRWYRKEVRIIRKEKGYNSYRDAQGFRKNNLPLKVKQIPATIYHYGWVKDPRLQQAKQEYFHKLWHNDDWVEKHIPKQSQFDYSNIDSLRRFQGTHPKFIQERITKRNWEFTFDPTQKKFSLKDRFLHWFEKQTGWRIGEYKNYKII